MLHSIYKLNITNKTTELQLFWWVYPTNELVPPDPSEMLQTGPPSPMGQDIKQPSRAVQRKARESRTCRIARMMLPIKSIRKNLLLRTAGDLEKVLTKRASVPMKVMAAMAIMAVFAE